MRNDLKEVNWGNVNDYNIEEGWKLALCVPPFCHFATVQYGYAAKWRHTPQACRIKNASSDYNTYGQNIA